MVLFDDEYQGHYHQDADQPQGHPLQGFVQSVRLVFWRTQAISLSHRVYKTPWPGDPRVNIQNDKGKAKAYQVQQVLQAVEKYEAEYGEIH